MKRLLLGLVLLAACDPPGGTPRWRAAGATQPRDGGTLRFASSSVITTLDPAIAYDEHSYVVIRMLFETLLDYEPDSTELTPRLAARWSVSEDARRYTFWVRRDARFEDGTKIGSRDIAFALNRVLQTPDSPFAQWLADVVGATLVIDGKATACAGITTPTEDQLVIELEHPNPAFKYVLAMPFTAPQKAAHVRAQGEQLRRHPLASGPYRLAAWSEGERLTLVRNEAYTGPLHGFIDQIVVLEGVPRDTQFLMFEQGELDTIDRLAAPDLLWIRAQPAWQPLIRTAPLLGVYGARFDVTKKPFDNASVRRAFSFALDRTHYQKLLTGTAIPAHGALPPGVAGRNDTLVPDAHDPAKARDLLAKAGYPDGLSVEYVTIADEEAEKLALAMQGDFAQAGIEMRITVVSFAVYLAMIGKPSAPAFSYAGWIADAPDATQFVDAKFHSAPSSEQSVANDSFYNNAQVDALLDAARVDPDPDRREKRYEEVEKILADDPPWLWGYHQAEVVINQPYVRDLRPHAVWVRDLSRAWLDLGVDGQRVPR